MRRLLQYFWVILFALSTFKSDFASSATIDGRPILSKVFGNDTLEYVGGEILVKVKTNAEPVQVAGLLSSNGAYVLRNFDKQNRWGLVGCDIDADIFEKIKTLRSSPLIEWAEPNLIIYPALIPNDEHYDTLQWPLNNTGDNIGTMTGHRQEGTPDADIDAPEAWDIETGDSSLIIAVLDSGIPIDSDTLCHPDLKDSYKFDLDIAWNCNVGPFGDRCVPTDSASIKDSCGHGTHVTGIISATTNNSIGIAGTIWYCKIMIIRIFDQQCGGTGDMACEGIRKAYKNGAKIINISAGGPWQYGDSDTTWFYQDMEDAIAEAESAGCLIVCAAGNEGEGTFRFPAGFASCGRNEGHEDGYRNVIAVGNSDFFDSLSSHSSWCDTLDVTVTAPGCAVFSTYPNYDYTYFWQNYGLGTGTSMSAPHVAGVAGLVKSKFPSLTPDEIRTRIENTADDICESGWDQRSGYGRLNAWRALLPFPNFYDTLWSDTTWTDSMYVIGDVVVMDTVTLTIDSGTVVKFRVEDDKKSGVDTSKCELIIRGKLLARGTNTSPIIFTSESSTPSDNDWYGISIMDDDSASASVEYANIEHAYKGIHYYNSASDTIKNCHFYNNQMYGIKTNNSNLFILNNLIEKSSYDDIGYGIYTQYSPTIWCNHIKNYKYGIYATGSANPTLERNKITNGRVGVYCYNTNSVSIDSFCFQGWFEDTYVKADKSSTVNIDHSYMEGDSTSYGAWYILTADGTIRRSGIFNYQDYGIYCQFNSDPDLGMSGSHGDNSFEGFALASRHVRHQCVHQVPIIDAVYNWWGTSDPPDSMFDTGVFWEPALDSVPPFYDACGGFSGPKIVYVTNKLHEKFLLSQNYPNPFNPTTVVRFTVDGSQSTVNSPVPVTLTIYNILGQKVKTLVNESKYPGTYEVVWDGKDEKGQKLATGIYFYRIKTDNFVESRKMLLLK